jgi:5-methylcytosine-specific restriction endonuclease McrA
MTAAEWEEVARRAFSCCEYCLSQLELSHDDFSIEHIQPKSAGGTDSLDNLALSCQGCNNRKYIATTATDPITGQVVPLYHPRQDRWEAHFCWDEDFATKTLQICSG